MGLLVSFQQTILVMLLVLLCISCSEPRQKNSSESSSTFVAESSVLDNRIQQNVNQIFEVIPPPDQQQTATGPFTFVNLGQPTVVNAIGVTEVSNDAPVNGFPIGETLVTWSVNDAAGNTANAIQAVIVSAQVACSTSALFFQQRVWPLINNICMECHVKDQVSSGLNFVDATVPDFLDQNYIAMRNSAVLLDNNNESVFLNKISNKYNDHGGDSVLAVSSIDYQIFSSMIDRFGLCEQINISPSDFKLLSATQQLRKTTLALTARLPTVNELATVNSVTSQPQVEEQMVAIIENLFAEKAFYNRLKEIYNDLILTDAFKDNAAGLGLPLNDFDNRNYFGTTELMQQGYNGTDSNLLRQFASYGISQAPLELVAYVVKNNLPFTEILTADYVMVNPYSATIFNAQVVGQSNFNFTYGANWLFYDYEQFFPVKLIDNKNRSIPHAGILTTIPFLSRYPSSSTSLNRKRARYVFEYFLDTDIEGLASRGGLDLSNVIGTFPTLQDPQCKECHDVLDPVAGLFKNWNVNGRFLGNNLNWLHTRQPPEMLPPGFNNSLADALPESTSGTALRWLGIKISNDNRFVSSTVKTIFEGFTGIDLVNDPIYFQSLKTLFITSNFNLKVLIKDIITSPYFIADNSLTQDLTGHFSDVGTAMLLTPEQLDRKINAVFHGAKWVSPSKRNLLSSDSYLTLYGGIDSIAITKRTTQPTSIISGIQSRIANQLSCELVPLDFKQFISQRHLFPYVQLTTVPDGSINTARIKQNIQHLFSHILGRELLVSDLEVDRAYNLFAAVMDMVNESSIAQECQGDLLSTDPIVIDSTHTVRAWTAVVNYMLRDFYFFYE